MKNIFGLFILITLFYFSSREAVAYEKTLNCSNRYVTLVNPVRGRALWFDKSLKPIINQQEESNQYNFPVTWLFQYDALTDDELMGVAKKFKKSDEKGLFLEVSKNLAEDSGVNFRGGLKWTNPGVIFLSGYKLSERRKIIDKVYSEFFSTFGYYPKAIGAWWIDSYSLGYIKTKYGLDSILIVADQKTTDSYGVWGAWWGVPYVPSISNVLTPTRKGGMDSVVLQWAQRDPMRAYGEGPNFSNFSLQANDYIRSGKNTEYFSELAQNYLDCRNEIAQITIGMETGMEAVDFHFEYKNQLAALSKISNLEFVTMSDFSKKYLQLHKKQKRIYLGDFVMTYQKRENKIFSDEIVYKKDIAFKDFFIPDKSDFLMRHLDNTSRKNGKPNYFLYVVILSAFIFLYKKRKAATWASHFMFSLASYYLLFASTRLFGWEVYFTPIEKYLYELQIFVYASSLGAFYLLDSVLQKYRSPKFALFTIALSYGIEGLISLIRYTTLSGQKFIGILINDTTLFGAKFGKGIVSFSFQDFPPLALNYFIKFPFDNIFNNMLLYLLLVPIFHTILGLIIFFILMKIKYRKRMFALLILAFFYCIYIIKLGGIDPINAVPILH